MAPQYMAARMSANLEMGLYICHATGAFPYTNVRFRWNEILRAREELDPTAQVWSPLTKAFQELSFKFLNKVDSNFACSVRSDGRLGGFRSFLKKVWNAVGGEPNLNESERLARDFRDELTNAFNEAKADWDAIDRDLIKALGTGALAGAVAAGKFSPALAGSGFAVAGLAGLIGAEMKRREFRKKIPMSIFIDLDER